MRSVVRTLEGVRTSDGAGVALTRSFLSRMEFGKDTEERVERLVADHLFPAT
ncbi:MAG: hypothetical protein IH916_10155, partial [Acidobacteria bacterium]|nr:hypothetical protein [Acidobacteriota bacterium]